jgi:hypothetical protein
MIAFDVPTSTRCASSQVVCALLSCSSTLASWHGFGVSQSVLTSYGALGKQLLGKESTARFGHAHLAMCRNITEFCSVAGASQATHRSLVKFGSSGDGLGCVWQETPNAPKRYALPSFVIYHLKLNGTLQTSGGPNI